MKYNQKISFDGSPNAGIPLEILDIWMPGAISADRRRAFSAGAEASIARLLTIWQQWRIVRLFHCCVAQGNEKRLLRRL
jgi:hypothetical protein